MKSPLPADAGTNERKVFCEGSLDGDGTSAPDTCTQDPVPLNGSFTRNTIWVFFCF